MIYEVSLAEDSLPKGTFFADMTREQLFATKRSIVLGKTLQELLPNISNDFRNGNTLAKIAEDCHLKETFGVKEGTAINAVRCALVGYSGPFDETSAGVYFGLIPKEEYERLAMDHVRSGVELQRTNKIGIHGQTEEEHSKIGVIGAEAIGHTAWTKEELNYAIQLSQDKVYQRGMNSNATKIASEVNEKFHEGQKIRNANAIKKALHKHRKSSQ